LLSCARAPCIIARHAATSSADMTKRWGLERAPPPPPEPPRKRRSASPLSARSENVFISPALSWYSRPGFRAGEARRRAGFARLRSLYVRRLRVTVFCGCAGTRCGQRALRGQEWRGVVAFPGGLKGQKAQSDS